MKGEIPFEWEIIGAAPKTMRAKVKDGWIVLTIFDNNPTSIFVNDPYHTWTIWGEDEDE